MIWEYQTIIFEFTKGGLLSDKYVDEQEMQKTLNELGQTGWELINALLLGDGVLTFLKRASASPAHEPYGAPCNEHAEDHLLEVDGHIASQRDFSLRSRRDDKKSTVETDDPAMRPVLSPPFSIEPRHNQGDVRDTGYGSDMHRQNRDDDSDLFGGIRIT